MTYHPPKTYAECLADWNKAINLRCEWSTMVYGSYKFITLIQLASETHVHVPLVIHGPPVVRRGPPVARY